MYLVEVAYGMEQYQAERKEFEFNEKEKAKKYYNDCLKKKPVKISFYQLIQEDSSL